MTEPGTAKELLDQHVERLAGDTVECALAPDLAADTIDRLRVEVQALRTENGRMFDVCALQLRSQGEAYERSIVEAGRVALLAAADAMESDDTEIPDDWAVWLRGRAGVQGE